jgi:WhiB family redox-sensing transcriptional regulator
MTERDGTPLPTGWLGDAACRDTDPEAFFLAVKMGSSPYMTALTLARRICALCPVIVECDDAATRERDGVWAGIDRAAPARVQARQRASMRGLGVMAA